MSLTLRSASTSVATTKGSPLTHAEMDANWLHALQSANSEFAQSGTGAVDRTVSGVLLDRVNVLDFIPVALHAGIKARTNTTDLSSYIDAADAACCAGTTGLLDTPTVVAEHELFFPAGRYRHDSTLTFRGAPWVGEGMNATIFDYYGNTYAVDAVGTTGARKFLNISKMFINGSNAGTSARGLKLGWNQRSLRALSQVRIGQFDADGIYFAENSWQMSFYDVYVHACALVSGSGIGVDAAASLIDFDWYKLQLEGCGQAASSTGGGIDLDNGANTISKWTFHGLILQGNKGAAEGQFIDCISIGISGLFLESDLAAAGAVDGLIIGGTTNASITNAPRLTAVASHGGTALIVKGTAKVSLDGPNFGANWPDQISVEDTATVTLLSEGNLAQEKLTVAAGGTASPLNGTYTPTLTNVTNLDGSTAILCFWRRNGNQVTVTGKFNADATAAANTALRISLPIASAIAAEQDLAGFACGGANAEPARIFGAAATNDAQVQWTAVGTANAGWSFQFSYLVK